MSPQAGSPDHKLRACLTRATHQIDRALQYMNLVTPVIPKDENDPRQFLYQSMVLMLQSYYEEYLRCVVALGTFWKAPAIRTHLGQGQDDPERIELLPMAEVAALAQERVRFENKAKKLKAIMTVVAGVSPFPDPDTEAKCLQFATVRNMIAHRGGLPPSVTAPITNLTTVKLESRQVGETRFHRLELNAEFFRDSVLAIQRSLISIEMALTNDPTLRLGLPTGE
jgi:hypothetical protein